MSRLFGKIKELINSILKMQVDIKLEQQTQVNPMLAYLLVILGTVGLAKLVYGAYKQMLHPTLRKFVLLLVQGGRRESPLFARDALEWEANHKRWVIILGATNNVGTCMARVFAKHGYSIVLVDSNMDKLQHLQTDLLRVFPQITPFTLRNPSASQAEIGMAAYLGQSVQTVNINFAHWKDSTTLEKRVREIFSLITP
jgi:hypothetical protein